MCSQIGGTASQPHRAGWARKGGAMCSCDPTASRASSCESCAASPSGVQQRGESTSPYPAPRSGHPSCPPAVSPTAPGAYPKEDTVHPAQKAPDASRKNNLDPLQGLLLLRTWRSSSRLQDGACCGPKSSKQDGPGDRHPRAQLSHTGLTCKQQRQVLPSSCRACGALPGSWAPNPKSLSFLAQSVRFPSGNAEVKIHPNTEGQEDPRAPTKNDFFI